MNEYKEVSIIRTKRNEIDFDSGSIITAEIRDDICREALFLDDEEFEAKIGKIASTSMIADCFFSEELLHLKFATRAFKYFWKFLASENDWKCVLDRICEITVELIDLNDFDFQEYLLDAREILRENFEMDMSKFDIVDSDDPDDGD